MLHRNIVSVIAKLCSIPSMALSWKLQGLLLCKAMSRQAGGVQLTFPACG